MTAGDFKNGTNLISKVLCSIQCASGEQTAYIVPGNTFVKITHGVVTNVSGSTVTVSVGVVPSGGTSDNTHRVVYNLVVAAGDSVSLKDYLAGAMLGPGDFVSINASAATAADLILTGVVSS